MTFRADTMCVGCGQLVIIYVVAPRMLPTQDRFVFECPVCHAPVNEALRVYEDRRLSGTGTLNCSNALLNALPSSTCRPPSGLAALRPPGLGPEDDGAMKAV
jgi:hypothetical protein